MCDSPDVPCDMCKMVEVVGHDLDSLLFAWLDELLFIFSTELLVFSDIRVTTFNRQEYKITATGWGVGGRRGGG